ncbi:MAG: PilN domain-containing protein, partial [Bacteroidota bacterium]
GSEDTMILFFTGRDLRHYERLRSLSSYDAPETICSRVMLQQDEQKIGEIHHVLVVSEGREEQILNVFRRMFADAAVETVGDVLESMGVQTPRDADRIPPGSLPAVVAALRVLEDWDKDDSDFAFQLLPKKMQRESKTLVFAWHTLAAMLILVVVAFAFSWRYMDQQTEIERMREEMRQNPVVLPVDNPALLKARVDSLQAAYMMYTQALNVIDSLLVGSDRWTRMHERVTRSTSDIGGVWISSMEPIGSRSIRVKGTATTRTKVAQFARHHQGSIERVSSNEVKHESRNLTLYDFTVTAPVAHETPRVALYLQDVSAGHIQDTAVDSVLAAYEARNLYAPGHAPVEASSNR